MEDIKSTKKDFEIKICGAEIVRLWLGEKDFRKLFIVTESRYEKYEPQSIIDTIDGKVSRDDSYIILEKCVGLHFGFYLQLFIVENFPEIKYKQLENIINLLSKYEGIDSRIYILYNIGEELSKCSNAEQKSQKIEACCICLRTLIPIYQKLYVDTVDTIIDEYIKHYSYDTIVGLVDGKRKIVKYFKKLRHQTDDNAYPYYYSVEGIIRDIERKLEDQDDPTIILENTKDSLLAIKNRFDYLMQKRSYYERPDYIFQLPGWWRQLRNSNLDLIERSQAQIINKSHKKYKE